MKKLADYAISFVIGGAVIIAALVFMGDVSGDTEKTVVKTAVLLWFASGYYLNSRLEKVHEKLDFISSELARIEAGARESRNWVD